MDPFAAGISATATLVVFWSLWTRRLTWRYRWESANTVAIGFLALAAVFLAPSGQIVGRVLNKVSGIANLQFFIAHLCALGATSAMLFMCMSKLCPEGEDPDHYYRHKFLPKFTYRITLPVLLGILAMFAFFAGSTRDKYPDPQWMQHPIHGHYLAGYWITYSILMLHLLSRLIRSLIYLREDEGGRFLVDTYLVAAILGAGAMLVRIVTALVWSWQTHLTTDCMWAVTTLSAALFAVGAALAWMNRVRQFTHRPGWGGLSAPRFQPERSKPPTKPVQKDSNEC